MPQRKKTINNENYRPIRKTTIQEINYTEELRLPQMGTMDLKNVAKSIQLKKNQSKKPGSRKSRCLSVKQSINTQQKPLCYKHFIRRFKQLKLIQEKQSTKSPASCKSKSKTKRNKSAKGWKKIGHLSTVKPKSTSQLNIADKLERTLKKLNISDYFKDEDELVPIVSSSQAFTMEQKQRIQMVELENDEQIDMQQIRKFCSGSETCYKKNIIFFQGNQYELMAIRIQRAWRRYQTKKLVQRYMYMMQGDGQSSKYFERESMLYEEQQNNIIIPRINDEQVSGGSVIIENLYEQEESSNKITYISNLQDDESIEQYRRQQNIRKLRNNEENIKEYRNKQIKNRTKNNKNNHNYQQISYQIQQKISQQQQKQITNNNLMIINKQNNLEYQEMIEKIKLDQLKKWDQIILLISLSKNDNPKQIQHLLKHLANQSEINKKQLENKSNQLLEYSSKKQQQQNNNNNNSNRVRYYGRSESEGSDTHKQQEFDSKKYIEYLDCDMMFPIKDDNNNSSDQYLSYDKQNYKSYIPKRISKRKQQQLLASLKIQNTLYNIHSGSMKVIPIKISSINQLKKSISEKNLNRIISVLSSEQILNNNDINIELLTKQFLQGSNPMQSLDDLHSEKILRLHLSELNKLRQYKNNENQRQNINLIQNNKIKIQHQQLQQQQKQQQICSQINEQLYEITQQQNQGNQKSIIIFNSLISQFLKEIIKYQNSILNHFKNYILMKKTVFRKNIHRKKGFPTNQIQIKLFLDNINNYILKYQNIFKNLEIPTGPEIFELLRWMRRQGPTQQPQFDQDQDTSSNMIVPNWIFDQMWEDKLKTMVYQVPSGIQINEIKFKQNFQWLRNYNKTFYRSLFDSFNECFELERNFGSFGKPYPWKYRALFYHRRTLSQNKKILENVNKRFMNVVTTYCGILLQRQQLTINYNQDYVQQMQQDRLANMLATDLIQAENRWFFYEDQETQIMFEVANLIQTQLFSEDFI